MEKQFPPRSPIPKTLFPQPFYPRQHSNAKGSQTNVSYLRDSEKPSHARSISVCGERLNEHTVCSQ